MAALLTILYDVLIAPISGVIELAFSLMLRLLGDPGWAVVGVSLVVNLLSNPLYAMADSLRDKERARQESMARWVNHIKKHFKGDERFMMLNTYYREQGYKQSYALSFSVSLLLQIPIFTAAYRRISELPALSGASFFGIADLAAPDALITVAGTTVNFLPIAMTLLNCASTFVYTRGQPLRDKIQAYGLAAVFLVLLYRSPSGLVLYWTCNQIFSLARNIVTKLLPIKLPKLSSERLRSLFKAEGPISPVACFFLAAGTITALVGTLIPSALMSASPDEFISASGFSNPTDFVVHATCVLGGLFMFWVGVYFFLSEERGKRTFAFVMALLACVMLVNYFVFPGDLGIINADLSYDQAPHFELRFITLNLMAIVAVFAVFTLIWKRASKFVVPFLSIMLIAVVALSVPNIVSLRKASASVADEQAMAQLIVSGDDESTTEQAGATTPIPFDEDGNPLPIINLSRNGKNVVVIFLDRAIGAMVPYILNERPDLAEIYDGFTFYPNTISFGPKTVFGSPPLLGGYEYTPSAMNARTDELLKDKHNEALRVLPTIFSNAGYDVTLFDVPLADYTFYQYDYSLFDDIANTKAYHSMGAYTDWYLSIGSKQGAAHATEGGESTEATLDVTQMRDAMRRHFERSICYYSLFKVAPLFARVGIYDEANYLAPANSVDELHAAELVSSATVARSAVRPFLRMLLRHAPDEGMVNAILFNESPAEGVDVEFYGDEETDIEEDRPAVQIADEEVLSSGRTTDHVIINEFLDNYAAVAALTTITSVDDSEANHYVFFGNSMTHTPDLLLVPDYVPSTTIDNTLYSDVNAYTVNDRTLQLNSVWRQAHYQCNMSALLRVGEYLDYLRAQGAYDNTRIVIVSDHGQNLGSIEEMVFADKLDTMYLNPLLMVKDFNAHGSLVISDEFMTNADAPLFAIQDVIENPVNPYTGVRLDDSEKSAHAQLVTTSEHWQVDEFQTGSVFDTSDGAWFSVEDNIFEYDNWQQVWDY